MPSLIVIHDQPLAFLWSVFNRANGTNVKYNEVYFIDSMCNFELVTDSTWLHRVDFCLLLFDWIKFTWNDKIKILSYKFEVFHFLLEKSAHIFQSFWMRSVSGIAVFCLYTSLILSQVILKIKEHFLFIWIQFYVFVSQFLLFPLILVCFCFSLFEMIIVKSFSSFAIVFIVLIDLYITRVCVSMCIVHIYASYDGMGTFPFVGFLCF